jgi:hypothetical protein
LPGAPSSADSNSVVNVVSVVPEADRNGTPEPTRPDVSPAFEDLLRLGERLDYPTFRHAPHLSVAAGKSCWETFAASADPAEIHRAIEVARDLASRPPTSNTEENSHG